MKTKVLIIGSGPAGYSAAIYTARANLNPILISGKEQGGQLTMTTDVENYPGFAEPINGPFLMEQMLKQSQNVGANIITDYVTSVDFSKRPFVVKTELGNEYIAESIIIATGAQAKWLGIASEMEFKGYGISGCATCDGFFYKNKSVAVVGGGNTAVEEAIFLTNHASKVYLIHRKDFLKAEKVMQDRLFSNPKVHPIWNSEIIEFIGERLPIKYLTSIKLNNVLTGEKSDLVLDGVFVAIGHRPSTDLFKGNLDLDEYGYINTIPGSTRTNIKGVFAAGDVQDKKYRQAVTAAGSGCMAALDVEHFLGNE